MIGNGFDLNLDLKTGYADFYKYYKEKTKDDIILRSIKNNYELWADLEVGLGLLLKEIDESQIDEFLDAKANLEFHLTEYLTKENSRIKIEDKTKFTEEFSNKILNFYDGFCTEDKNQLNAEIHVTNGSILYQFITFNYTDVLDKMIEIVRNEKKPFGNHSTSTNNYSDIICKPHHVHGTLDGDDLVLCVDNPSQIANEAFQSDRRITDYMIKTNVNKELGGRKTEIAKEIIDNSRYICLYGLSIGDTDSTWWKYLIEWLKKSEKNRLVLFVRDDSKVHRSGSESIRIRNNKRAYFGKRAGCVDDELYNKISNKIIVVRNSKIFTYENIVTEETDNGQT